MAVGETVVGDPEPGVHEFRTGPSAQPVEVAGEPFVHRGAVHLAKAGGLGHKHQPDRHAPFLGQRHQVRQRRPAPPPGVMAAR